MTVLSDNTIRAGMASGQLVRLGVPENARRAAYDFRASKVFSAPRAADSTSPSVVDLGTDSHIVRPGEILIVQTIEELVLPDDVCGYKLPTNSLSHEGLHMLNPGQLPPGFEGPLAGTFVNFGSKDLVIDSQTVILRVAFHQLDQSVAEPSKALSRDFLDSWMKKKAVDLPRSYLDLDMQLPKLKESARAVADAEVERIKTDTKSYFGKAWALAGAAILILGLGQVVATALVSGFSSWSAETAEEKAKAQTRALVKELIDRFEDEKLKTDVLRSNPVVVGNSESIVQDVVGDIQPQLEELNERLKQLEARPPNGSQ